jgi:TRAP-type uncharacterized transport system substrate-binding protein
MEGLFKRVRSSAFTKVRALSSSLKEELAIDWEIARQLRYPIIALMAATTILVFFSNPPPPKRVVLASGAPGTTYAEFGDRYREFFAKQGIDLVLVKTEGSVENSRLITDPKSDVEIAFIQAGLLKRDDARNVMSLGSLDYEPMWLFFRGADQHEKLQKFMDIGRRKIAIGPVGSGSYAAATKLLALNKRALTDNILPMPAEQAVAALSRNEIDAVFLVDGPDSENVRQLVQNPNLQLASFSRSAAYAHIISHWQSLVVPVGGLDLERNFPPANTEIIATTTDLVVKSDLHPAIQMLLMQAAEEVNGKASYFAKRGEFPVFKNAELEESKEALIFFKRGPPLLMNYLPFWLGEFANRMFFYLIPFFVLSRPIIMGVLNYRLSQGRVKINTVYNGLVTLEKQSCSSLYRLDRKGALDKLDDIERSTLKMKIPKDLSNEYFLMRSNIDYLRQRLSRLDPIDGREPADSVESLTDMASVSDAQGDGHEALGRAITPY